jgi:VanZ family protein
VWAAIVFLLHVVKVQMENDSLRLFPHSDKVIHFTMFFLLAAAMVLAFVKLNAIKIPLNTALAILFACACYGAMLEYLQGTHWVNRDSDVLDWIADLAGSATGIFLCQRLVLTRLWPMSS